MWILPYRQTDRKEAIEYTVNMLRKHIEHGYDIVDLPNPDKTRKATVEEFMALAVPDKIAADIQRFNISKNSLVDIFVTCDMKLSITWEVDANEAGNFHINLEIITGSQGFWHEIFIRDSLVSGCRFNSKEKFYIPKHEISKSMDIIAWHIRSNANAHYVFQNKSEGVE